jgi:predicted nucleic acid-binding Zn ribbon protein
MVDDHKHCIVCGKSVPLDRLFCSPSCEEVFKQQQKRMKKTRTYTMVFFVLLFALLMVVSAVKR